MQLSYARFATTVFALSLPSIAVADAGITFRSLDACLASEAQTKAQADRAETALGAIEQPLSTAFHDALIERNELLSRLSDIRSACSKLRIAGKAGRGDLKKEPLASQVSQMNELHELLSDGVLKSVPNPTIRKIQEQNLGTVRSQMSDLAKIMDNSIGAIGQPVADSPRSAGTSLPLAGHPDPAVSGVLGSTAAARLESDVQTWKSQEAQRQEQIKLAQLARQAEEARAAAEQRRMAEARYQAQLVAAQQERERRSSAANDFLSGALGFLGAAVAIKNARGRGTNSEGLTNPVVLRRNEPATTPNSSGRGHSSLDTTPNEVSCNRDLGNC